MHLAFSNGIVGGTLQQLTGLHLASRGPSAIAKLAVAFITRMRMRNAQSTLKPLNCRLQPRMHDALYTCPTVFWLGSAVVCRPN